MFKIDFNHRFGRYALALYQRPDVAQCCLSLQDEQKMDVNLLLWAHWLDHQLLTFDPQLWKSAEARVRYWRLGVIHPLRLIRRCLKFVLGGEGRFYTAAKQIELWAESIAMQRLSLIAEEVVAHSGGAGQTNQDSAYTRYYFALCKAEAELPVWLSMAAARQE